MHSFPGSTASEGMKGHPESNPASTFYLETQQQISNMTSFVTGSHVIKLPYRGWKGTCSCKCAGQLWVGKIFSRTQYPNINKQKYLGSYVINCGFY